MKICCLTLVFILTVNGCCKAAPPVRPKQKSHYVRLYPIDQNEYDAVLKLTEGKRVIKEGRLIDGGFTTVSDGFDSLSKDASFGWSSFSRAAGFTPTTYPEPQVKYDGQPLCTIRSTDIYYNPKNQGREFLIDDELEPIDEDQNVINCFIVLNRKPADDVKDDSHSDDDHNNHYDHNNNQAPSSSFVYGYPYTLIPYIYIQKEPITVTIPQPQQQNYESTSKETDDSEMEVEDATTNADKNNDKQTTDEMINKTPITTTSDSNTMEKSTERQLSPNNVPAVPSNSYVYGQPPYGQQPFIPHPAGPYGHPPYGQPPYGQPPYGRPPYGQPIYGQPPFGQPIYGQPPYGNQIYGSPPYGPQLPYGQQLYGPQPYPTSLYGPNVPGYPIGYLYGSDENKEQAASDPRLNEDYDEHF